MPFIKRAGKAPSEEREENALRIIGLTGSIGCGKSHVSSVLSSLGACIIDGDRISHMLTALDGAALPGIRQIFGNGVFQRDILDRRALGALVFSDPAARQKLDNLMQPLILQEIQRQLAQAQARNDPVAVLDMPLLFETGLDSLCDTVWCVWLPEALQIRRIMERDGLTEAETRARIASQLPGDEKRRRSQVVIDTSGTLEETARLIPDLYQKELEAAGVTRRRRSGRRVSTPTVPDEEQEPFTVPQPQASVRPAVPVFPPQPQPQIGFSSQPQTPTPAPVPVERTYRRRTAAAQPADAPASIHRGTQSRTAAAQPADVPSSIHRRTQSRTAAAQPADAPASIHRGTQTRRSVFDPERTPVPEKPAFPKSLMILLIAFVLLAAGTIVGSTFMQGYLKKQQDERERAYQDLVDRHPYNYESLIRSNAGYFGLRSAYVAAIILNESNFNPRAVSSVGARGLMQIMPDTAEWIAERLNDRTYSFEKMYDPETNIRYGCWYLNYLSGLFLGDPVAVTTAYHAGQGTVRTWLADGTSSTDGGRTLNIDTMPDGPTKTYAKRVIRAYAIYDALYDHVFNPVPAAGTLPGAGQ